jgi:hypothetical protein
VSKWRPWTNFYKKNPSDSKQGANVRPTTRYSGVDDSYESHVFKDEPDDVLDSPAFDDVPTTGLARADERSAGSKTPELNEEKRKCTAAHFT